MECNRTLIIAEAGVNHNGSLELAMKMVDEAKRAGADIVKFQTAIPEAVMSRYAPKAEYQKYTTDETESQLEMCKKIHLKFDEYYPLYNHCKDVGIKFLSAPFDLESIDFLEELGCDMWKIPSGEVTNYPYLVKMARTHKPIIMSTGMCCMEEISSALDVLRTNGAKDIILLHCNTQYPTPYSDVNLKAMKTMEEAFMLPVGYSDHTIGIEIPIAAVAMGAKIIEKHFTLDKTMEGPDHIASLEPDDLKQMVSSIRNIEKAVGDGIKKVTDSEKDNAKIARKSIVARRSISVGEIFSEENITTKRPGTGISPMRWEAVIGQKAFRNFEEDELIEIQ